VKPLVLTLRQTPEQRLDLSPLVAHRLAGKTAAEIAQIELQTTRVRVTVGDIFRLRLGDPRQIRIENACERLDRVGHDMADGEILAEGDVGIQAGRMMRGGRLTIAGDAGPWAASAMAGGTLEITGNAGDRLGGPLAGETTGMRGGVVIVRGHVGERAGDRLRRGMILVEGGAGRYAGCRMIAGTLVARRIVGPFPGYLMRRGTIILGEGSDALSPTFVDCGLHDLVALRIMTLWVETYSARLAAVLRQPRRRFAGDMAVTGKGEIFTPP
jgi:formylmethanofuran dehydrogenase subunit C